MVNCAQLIKHMKSKARTYIFTQSHLETILISVIAVFLNCEEKIVSRKIWNCDS